MPLPRQVHAIEQVHVIVSARVLAGHLKRQVCSAEALVKVEGVVSRDSSEGKYLARHHKRVICKAYLEAPLQGNLYGKARGKHLE